MLFTLYPAITQNYYILSFVTCLGTLQFVAARNQILTLSFLGPWGIGFTGAGVGMFLIVGGFGWFFATTPGLFDSGLAGGELSLLFATGALSALAVTRLCSVCWQKFHK
jgi:hypothetical protein